MVLPANHHTTDDFNPRFKIFHELMPIKVSDVQLVSAVLGLTSAFEIDYIKNWHLPNLSPPKLCAGGFR